MQRDWRFKPRHCGAKTHMDTVPKRNLPVFATSIIKLIGMREVARVSVCGTQHHID